jgi:membrane-associated protease RseP (regulator of RpoE activity)
MFKNKLISIALAAALFPFFLAAQPGAFLGIRVEKGETWTTCAVIGELAPGGPGELAGLAPGDVIRTIDGVEVDCAKIQQGAPIAPQVEPGTQVIFGILRAGKKVDIPVVATNFPNRGTEVDPERARLEAGRAVLQRLVKTREVFTITLTPGGGFQVSGQMSPEDAAALHYFFEKKGDAAIFPRVMKSNRQDMYLHFDREKGGIQYEFIDSSTAAPPKQ